ncbi:TolC family protein [Pontibacter ruber]|uniref:TolC family protein n=1 Tax=Pontibacter ruber TaxID=1343895 RepID=A0ABW5CYG0_9BACT|nr:TolC family protein [Pontibacter ruber]
MKNVTTGALLKKLGGLLFCAFLIVEVQAQQALTLEQSLELARQHNVALRQAQHNATKSNINLRRSQFAYLPTVSAQADASRVNGLTFDNVSGEVKRGNTTTSNPYMVGQLVLFDGFTRYFELKQADKYAEAGKYQQAQAEIDLEANVTGYFLQAILDRENATITRDRITLLQSQLEKIEKLERAGVRTEADVYQIKSQLATEKLNLITNENSYRRSMLALVQEINAGAETAYQLQVPTAPVDINSELLPLESVMERAVAYSPQLKAAKASLEASRHGLSVARSGLSPTLSVEGILGSRFSSNVKELKQETNTFEQINYFDQLDQNRQKIVQLSLRIPVFNGFTSHLDAQTAKVDMRKAELDYITSQNTLRQTIEQAYQEVLSARERYNTVQASIEYSEKAFEAAKRKYESGTLDFFSYMESLNNKNRAQIELLQSKCEFYFRHRILELYQG